LKIKNVVLLTLDGLPLKEQAHPSIPVDPNSPPVTAARVIEAWAMNGPKQGQVALTAEENVERLLLAIACHKAPLNDEIEIDAKMSAKIKEDVQSLAPIIAGQMALILEGKDAPIAAA
jgi:hypothetical protein